MFSLQKTDTPPSFIQSIFDKKAKKLDTKAKKEASDFIHTQRMNEIFDALLTLPICIPNTNDTSAGRTLTNAINGITLHISDNKRQSIKMRTMPSYISSAGTQVGVRLELDEAEKLLAAWTLMCKPYFVMNWANQLESASAHQPEKGNETPHQHENGDE